VANAGCLSQCFVNKNLLLALRIARFQIHRITKLRNHTECHFHRKRSLIPHLQRRRLMGECPTMSRMG
jgi:hypothetical protein